MDEATGGTCVLAEDHGQVQVLTLNRPGRRNAIDLELRAEAGAGRGRGNAFGAGAALALACDRVVTAADAASRPSGAGDNLTLINNGQLMMTGGDAWPPPRGT